MRHFVKRGALKWHKGAAENATRKTCNRRLVYSKISRQRVYTFARNYSNPVKTKCICNEDNTKTTTTMTGVTAKHVAVSETDERAKQILLWALHCCHSNKKLADPTLVCELMLSEAFFDVCEHFLYRVYEPANARVPYHVSHA